CHACGGVESRADDTRVLPSGEKASVWNTDGRVVCQCSFSLPVAGSQRYILPGSWAEARSLPSAEKATAPRWYGLGPRSRISLPFCTLKIRRASSSASATHGSVGDAAKSWNGPFFVSPRRSSLPLLRAHSRTAPSSPAEISVSPPNG